MIGPDRRRQDRDRAPARAAGRRAVRQGQATKFTEVGYVGRDVDTIMRDLIEVAVKQTRETEARKVRDRAADAAEERILDVLLPPAREVNFDDMKPADNATRQKFRKMLREGAPRRQGRRRSRSPCCRRRMEIMAPPGMEDLTRADPGHVPAGGRRAAQGAASMKVAEAMKALTDEEAGAAGQRRRDQGEGARRRSSRTASCSWTRSTRSRRGPRCRARTCRARACSATSCRWSRGRPCRPSTGWCGTDHVLFIASGAFHLSKPSDLIPELQGRFPIRVELASLTVDGLRADPDGDRRVPGHAVRGAARAPRTSSSTSGPTAIRRIAEIAFAVNEKQENIGARRLLHGDGAPARGGSRSPRRGTTGETIAIDAAYVDARLADVAGDDNLAKYILLSTSGDACRDAASGVLGIIVPVFAVIALGWVWGAGARSPDMTVVNRRR